MVIVLTGVTVVAGAALGYVNEVTKGPIEQIKADKLGNAIKVVLNAGAVTVNQVDTLDENTLVYSTDNGVAVQTVANGFGGALKVLVGFNAEGAILGYNVLEHAETPGLGAKAGEWFQKGAKGDIIGKTPGEAGLTVSKDGGQVDAITASTITSRAFLAAVNSAYNAFKGKNVDSCSGATLQDAQTQGCDKENCDGKCDKANCDKEGCDKEGCKNACDDAAKCVNE